MAPASTDKNCSNTIPHLKNDLNVSVTQLTAVKYQGRVQGDSLGSDERTML